jgi:mono/diheme cytochrome c family protein
VKAGFKIAALAVLAVGGAGLVQAAAPVVNADAAKIKNPVAANPASIAAGKKLYEDKCAPCHGPGGKGDGTAVGAEYGTKPADLTLPALKHGSTDGELFHNIGEGIPPNYNMAPWADQITDEQIWNIVNFLQKGLRKQ